MMVDVLNFLFASPEHFFGCLVLLLIVCFTIDSVVGSIANGIAHRNSK